MAVNTRLVESILALYPDLSFRDDPISGSKADFRVFNNPDGTQELTEWNTTKYPRPSNLDLAHGRYLYARQQAEERVGLAYVGALRNLYPEMTQPNMIDRFPEGWLAVLVTEVMRNNNPTRRQNAITQANTWTARRSQITAITLSANPTEQEYLDKAAQLEAITW